MGLFKRHVTRWHNSISAETSGQLTLAKFSSEIQFSKTHSTAVKIRKASVQLIADNNLPLSFFETEGFKKFSSSILQPFNINKATSNALFPSAKLVKNELKNNSDENLRILKAYGKKMAKCGNVGFAIDHKAFTTISTEDDDSALGIELLIRLPDDNIINYLIRLVSVAEKDDQTTAWIVLDVIRVRFIKNRGFESTILSQYY